MGTSTSKLEDIVGIDEFGGSSMAGVKCCPDGPDLGGLRRCGGAEHSTCNMVMGQKKQKFINA